MKIFHIQSLTRLFCRKKKPQTKLKRACDVSEQTINNSLAEGRGEEKTKAKLLPATRINNDKSTSSHLSSVEIGVEASFPFLSHLAVCVMFICSYTVSALLLDSWAAPKEEASISRKSALLWAQRCNVKGMCMLL